MIRTHRKTDRYRNSRAAAAAARVAARYAKTPSFSEMQAMEARNALRAAEAATRAALEAQAAAQAVLDHIQNHGNQVDEQEYAAHRVETETGDRQAQNFVNVPRNDETTANDLEIRWEPDMPVRPAQQETRSTSSYAWDGPAVGQNRIPRIRTTMRSVYEAVEAAQPIPANLIEFPREIIATRRMRPRITEVNPESI